MFAKFIATLFLICTSFLITLGNFWFTYGVWPRSFKSLFIFVFLGILNYGALQAVAKSGTKK